MNHYSSLQDIRATGTRQLTILMSVILAMSWGGREAQADLVEPFTYGDGALNAVSGGTWRFWNGSSGDAAVQDGAVLFGTSTDVIRLFPAVLKATGTTALLSFTINVPASNSPYAYEIDVVPASNPFTANTNYGGGFGLAFDRLGVGDNTSSIEVSEGSGVQSSNNGGNNNFQLGSMSVGVTHAIRVTFARNATNVAYSFFLDNALLHSGTFKINDSRSINAMEFVQFGSPTGGAETAVLDDLNLVSGFRMWVAEAGLSGAEAAAGADPDGDGRPNAVEYVLGGNPTGPSATAPTQIRLEGGNFIFTFDRPDAFETTDVTLKVEVGTDLLSWPASYNVARTTSLSSPGVIVVENGTGPDTVTVTIPQGANPTLFARLKVTVAP